MGLIIVIGGLPGSGKSTLGKMLAARLRVPFYSMGDVRRAYARDRGWTLDELNRRAEIDPASDHLVDRFQTELPKREASFVIDSRLGFHFIPGAVKVFLHASVRTCAQRILRTNRSEEKWTIIEDGVRSLTERVASDKRRYAALYGVDPLDEAVYDIVLDSETADPFVLLNQLLDELRRRGHEVQDTQTI